MLRCSVTMDKGGLRLPSTLPRSSLLVSTSFGQRTAINYAAQNARLLGTMGRREQPLPRRHATKADLSGNGRTTSTITVPPQQEALDNAAAKRKLSTKDALQLVRADLKEERAKNAALQKELVAVGTSESTQQDGRQMVQLDRVEQLLDAVKANEREGAAVWKADMSKVLERAGEELRVAKAALEASRNALELAQADKQDLRERCERLEDTIEDLQERMRLAKQEATVHHEKWHEAWAQLSKVNSDLDGRTPREVLDMLETKTAALDAVKVELDITHALLTQRDTHLEHSAAYKAELLSILDGERRRSAAAEVKLDQLLQERDAAESLANQKAESIQGLHHDLDVLRRAHDKIADELQQALADVAAARDEAARAVSGGAKMRELRQMAERERDERVAALGADVAAKEKELANLQHSLEEALELRQMAEQDRNERFAAMSADFAAKEKVSAQLQHNLNEALAKVKRLEETLKEAEQDSRRQRLNILIQRRKHQEAAAAEIKKLKDERAAAQADVARGEALARSAIAECAAFKSRVLELEAEAEKLRDEAVELRRCHDERAESRELFLIADLDAANTANAELQASLASARRERDEAMKQGETAVNTAADDVAAAKQEAQVAREALAASEVRLAELKAAEQQRDDMPQAAVATLEAQWAVEVAVARQERDEAVKRGKAVASAAAADLQTAVAGAEAARGEQARLEREVAGLKADAARVKHEREDAFVRSDLRATDLTAKLRKAEARAAAAEQEAASLRGKLEGAGQTLALQDDVTAKLRQALAQSQANVRELNSMREQLDVAHLQLAQSKCKVDKLQDTVKQLKGRIPEMGVATGLDNELQAVRDAMMLGALPDVTEIIDATEGRWVVHLAGPNDSPYADQIFVIQLVFPDACPTDLPIVQFLSPIFHPDVDDFGVLKWADGANSLNGSFGIVSGVACIAAISTQLAQPQASGNSPNRVAARLYRNDWTEFFARAQGGH